MKKVVKKPNKQYTIRGVPAEVDRKLRERAKKEGKSLNEVALEVLKEAAGMENGKKIYTDLDFLIGTWEHEPVFDEVRADHERIDEELWR